MQLQNRSQAAAAVHQLFSLTGLVAPQPRSALEL